ncbi:MAG: pilin [bacterium]
MKKIIFGLILISFLIMPVVALAARDCTTPCDGIIDDPNTTIDEHADCITRCENALIAGKEEITNLVITITNWFAGIVFAIAVIMIIYGGVLYITAAGSEDQTKKAQSLLTYAVIGIAVALLAFGAQALISSFLGMGSVK